MDEGKKKADNQWQLSGRGESPVLPGVSLIPLPPGFLLAEGMEDVEEDRERGLRLKELFSVRIL